MANDAHQVKALLAQLKAQEQRIKGETASQGPTSNNLMPLGVKPLPPTELHPTAVDLNTHFELETGQQLHAPRLDPHITDLLAQISPSVLQLVASQPALRPESSKISVHSDLTTQLNDPRSIVFATLDADVSLVRRLVKVLESLNSSVVNSHLFLAPKETTSTRTATVERKVGHYSNIPRGNEPTQS
jgi:hypothetical protein